MHKKTKILILIFIVPLYLFNLIGEYWQSRTYFGSPRFNFKTFNKEFVRDFKSLFIKE